MKSLIVCNGYKDDEFIRLALFGRRLGKEIFLVVEQLSEVPRIIQMSKQLGVRPLIGLRIKLSTAGEEVGQLFGRGGEVRLNQSGDSGRGAAPEACGAGGLPAVNSFPHWLTGAEYSDDQEGGG